LSTVTVKRDLLENCKDREYREALNLENVYASVCGQMRNIRESQELSQAQLGRKAKMAQERISILEDPNAETKPTLNTLLRVAGALDVGLEVRFIPFSRVLDSSIDIAQQREKVPSFEEELPAIKEEIVREEAAQMRPVVSLAGLTNSPEDRAQWDKWSELLHQNFNRAMRTYREHYMGKQGGLVNPYANLAGALPISNTVTVEQPAPQKKKTVLIFVDDVDERKGMGTVAGSEWLTIPKVEAA
jgi:transcriptional regulator with XRE-family HTH domain